MILSVKKAMRILTALSVTSGEPLSLSALSEITEMNKSTCSHIVSTLMAEGYVERVSHTKGYILGPAAFCLSNNKRYGDTFIEQTRPVMKWLNKKTGYAVALTTIHGGNKFIINYIDPKREIYQEDLDIRYDDIYRTATGRVILANLPESDVYEVFKRHGAPRKEHWENIDSFEKLCSELRKIDKNGIVKTVMTDPCDESRYLIGYGVAVFKAYECKGAVGVALYLDKSEYAEFCRSENELKNMIFSARDEINRRIFYI